MLDEDRQVGLGASARACLLAGWLEEAIVQAKRQVGFITRSSACPPAVSKKASGSYGVNHTPRGIFLWTIFRVCQRRMRLLSGSSALRALYSSGLQQVDPWWPLDSASSLRSWLSDQSQRWVVDDPCFAAQRAIGEAELSAGEAYQELVRRHESALAAYFDSPGLSLIHI